MKRSTFLSPLVAAAVCVLAWGCSGSRVLGAEPAEEFLQGLRDLGYNDTALEYLERMAGEGGKLVTPEFREVVLFEKGVTLIHMAKTERDSVAREKLLDQAESALNQFTEQRATHELRSSAEAQMANLKIERARMRIEKANRKNTTAAEKTTLLSEARTMFGEALSVFQGQRESVKEKLQRIKPDLDETNPVERRLKKVRDQYRTDYLQARLLVPAILEEEADTHDPQAPEHNDLLKKAADEYKDVYNDYRTRIAGLYARLYQGRCYAKMKNHTEAISYYNDLLAQPDTHEAFRALKQKTLTLAVDSWLGGADVKYYNEAIKYLTEAISKLSPTQEREPEWLYLRLSLAKAYKLLADDLEKKSDKTREEFAAIKLALREASNHANYVIKYPSDYKDEARRFKAEDLGGGEFSGPTKQEPKTFAEARQAGKEILEEWQTAEATVKSLTEQIQNEKDPELLAELNAQLKNAQDMLENGGAYAMDMFRKSLTMADPETPTEDLNIVRYFMCYLYYVQGDYFDSALLGEFVSRRYPDSAGAKQTAKIAMASYLKLYKDNQTDDRSFEIQQTTKIAEYTLKRWPGTAESVEAANTLIAFMIKENKLDKAIEYLNEIPAESPKRGQAELSTGQAMWSSFLHGMEDVRKWKKEGPPEGVSIAAEETRLQTVKERAKETLFNGIERMKGSGTVDATLATACLSLSQMYVDSSEAAKAVALLEDQNIGPLTLIAKSDPSTQKVDEKGRKPYVIETYKTALRAYIAAMNSGSGSGEAVNKAKRIIDDLKKVMGDKPEGKKDLVAIFISLANDLKTQLDQLDNINEKRATATGLTTFLDEVSVGADDLEILMWAANTYSNVGQSFDEANATADAAKYYQKSVSAFRGILTKAESKDVPDDWLADEVKTQLMMRMATTEASVGNFETAIGLFKDLLEAKESMLNVQVMAAKTYQDWAKYLNDNKQPGAIATYKKAMSGTHEKYDERTKRDQNIIWGWGKLSQITARYEQFADTFHESRINLARCRLECGKLYSDPADQKKWKEAAFKDIELTKKLYPTMGGPTWRPQYDRLLREVQTALGMPQDGLAAFESKDGK